MIVSIFPSLSQYTLGFLATGKHVNRRDEYEVEFPTNLQPLHSHGTEKAH